MHVLINRGRGGTPESLWMESDEAVDLLSFEFSAVSGVEKVSSSVTDTSACPRILLYKNAGYALDQERRWRAELLNCRRHKHRNDKFDANRELSTQLLKSGNPWSTQLRLQEQKKPWNDHFARLMLAEWLLFIPPDFASQYLFKLCPKGRHVYIVASKGQTNVYSRTGLCLATMLTRLPGGGLGQSSSQMHRYQTILDCIMLGVPTATMTHQSRTSVDQFSTETSSSLGNNIILKVLDLISFRSTSYAQQRFRERCEWLESFHKEHIEAYEPGDVARFEIIPAYSCDSETMSSVFSSPPPFELDGVLFYHSDVAYRRGPTPLVGWLKPYMLPEWFPSVTVHPDYLRDMAPDYRDYLTDIERYKEATQKYKASFDEARKKSTKDVEMSQLP
ncbi:unnamed protein product [Mesocestoides corti]|uniref:Snurportin-1 n=2 Tax=Mesocestoides corti TaxID=53468 RepID=A0A0R3UGY3_MESCO|nr:unnamed protein product [Mesocestoides corti]